MWQNPHLIVERYIPGTAEPPLTHRRFEFFLDLELAYALTYDDPIDGTTLDLTFDVEPPPEVTDLRHRLAIDAGAIDYFEVDGEVTVVDVN